MPTSRILRPLLIVLLLAAIPPLAPLAAPGDDAPATGREPAKPRVIVRADRYTEVMGHVELEDDEVIVVRTLDGAVQSFAKARVTGIVRLVEPEPDQPGVVVLRNGQLRDGIIIEDAFDYVLIEIEGVRARLKREVVDHVVLEPTFQQRYEQYKQTLQPEMSQRHLALCRWLLEQREYELAKKELEELLANHPDLPEALRLSTIVQAQLALRDRPAKPAGEAGDDGDDASDGDDAESSGEAALPDDLISDADVNIIRVYEIDFRRPPKVAVSRDTIGRLIELYGTSREIPPSQTERQTLYRADPLQIVELMFNLRARELYGQIEVITEPYALNVFRQRVHDTWLINNCATSRCHGGGDGGRLFLHRRKHKDARVRYTNFLILERLELDAAMPLINYEIPMDSLLIQYGLPRQQARLPHPAVKGWKPAFRRPTDRMVQDAVRWMEAMFKPRPEYPVQFEPPLLDPAGPDAPEAGGEGGRRSR